MSPASSPSWASRPPKPTTGGCSPSCTTCDPDGFFLLAAPGPADVRDVAVCFQGFPEPGVLHAEALEWCWSCRAWWPGPGRWGACRCRGTRSGTGPGCGGRGPRRGCRLGGSRGFPGGGVVLKEERGDLRAAG